MKPATPPAQSRVEDEGAGGASGAGASGPRRSKLVMAAFNVVVIIFLIVAAVVIWGKPRKKTQKTVSVPAEAQAEPGVLTVTLFFAARDAQSLVPERREIATQGGALEENIRSVIAELAIGPSGEAARVLPEGAALRAAFLDGEGNLYLDFGQELRSQHWGGAAGERLTIEALRQTIAANFAAVRSVRVLVGGEPIESIAGHIDAQQPITVGGR
jgi:Sporulation and spore germination